MRKHIAISCLGALLGLTQTATADVNEDPNVDSASRDNATATASYYPRAWCIKTYLDANSRNAVVTRLAPPSLDRSASAASSGIAADQQFATTAYTDQSSLIERLRSLKARPFATLWRGRDTALVLRIQDGGYFGVSVDDTRTEAD